MAMNGNGKALDANSLPVKEYDGIIIGGGGSGLMSSLQLAQSGMNTAVIQRFFLLDLTQFLLKEVSHVP